ncbi:MAG TPA: CRISPR-associated endoribonuclease Cas6 [Candidatus Wirthbacteria bacterium]|nr:CRISPR-associated endoribonuclease Cas6 [Candidatus Wirthbacteria bacterium]
MRIHLKTSQNQSIVPFDNQYLLTGCLHKWLGTNDIHDEISLYSFSWLQNAQAENKGLRFPQGSNWFISCHDRDLIKQLIDGIRKEPDMFAGMQVTEVQMQETPVFGDSYTFKVASPVLAKYWDGESVKHLLWSDEPASKVLTRTLQTKLEKAGLSIKGVQVNFDTSYRGAKSHLVDIKDIKHRASMCPVIITGSPEQISFAWDVGVGHLTGCGFGSLW